MLLNSVFVEGTIAVGITRPGIKESQIENEARGKKKKKKKLGRVFSDGLILEKLTPLNIAVRNDSRGIFSGLSLSKQP